MSAADVERFVSDLKTNAELLAEVKGKPSGVASVVETARAHGYDISLAEVRSYIQERSSNPNLSEDELAFIAGGGTKVQAEAVEAAAVTTTVVETAETVTTVVQDAEVATTVAAVVELT